MHINQYIIHIRFAKTLTALFVCFYRKATVES